MEDNLFDSFQWDTEFQEWEGCITILPYGETVVGLPAEYPDSPELRKHIHAVMETIKQDELSFRERAANDLFVGGGYVLFLDENQQFDHQQFVSDMVLANITLSSDPSDPHLLSYEYGEDGMEHAILIHLTWDGAYHDARVM